VKRLLFFIIFLLPAVNAFCQSLTMDEISAMVSRQDQDNKSFLESKGFVLCQDCMGEGARFGYEKNKGTPDEEHVVFYTNSFEFFSLNLKVINTLMDQAKTKYKLVKTSQQEDPDDRKSLKSYWYADGNVGMSFIIFKSWGYISIGPKQ